MSQIPISHLSTVGRTADNAEGVISSIQVERRLPKLYWRGGGGGGWLLSRFRVVVPVIIPEVILLILRRRLGRWLAIGLFWLSPRNVPRRLFVIRVRWQLWCWD
jgi:hypothetical protein